MKILHTSDLHLNSKMNSKLSGQKAKERKRELLLNFRYMTEFAEREGCDAFIIAGDLFDSEKISISVLQATIDIIAAKQNITFFYLPGNHEKDALSNFGHLPDNLKLFAKEWTYYKMGGVTFAGRTETEAGMFSSFMPPENSSFVVAVLHGELRDRSDTGGIIGQKELSETLVNYLALGHYHSFGKYRFSERGYAVYSGTPLGRGFDEIGEKGFVIIDTNKNDVNFTFQKSKGRKLTLEKIVLSGEESAREIDDKISHACLNMQKQDLVRIVLSGYRNQAVRIERELLEAKHRSGFYYFEIKDETRLAINPDDYIHDRTLKGEFIRLVLRDEKLTDEEKDSVIDSGIRALLGEGYDT